MMKYQTIRRIAVLHFLLSALFLPGTELRARSDEILPASQERFLESEIETLNKLLANPGNNLRQAIQDLLEQTVDFDRLTRRTFGKYIRETLDDYEKPLNKEEFLRLEEAYQQRLVQAYQQRLVEDLVAWLRVSTVGTLRIQAYQIPPPEENWPSAPKVRTGKSTCAVTCGRWETSGRSRTWKSTVNSSVGNTVGSAKISWKKNTPYRCWWPT